MMDILLIDDEPKARMILRDLLAEYCPKLKVIGEAEGVQSGLALLKAEDPDLIFLDIRMKDGTGFDLLDSIKHRTFQLIFTTAYDEFALKAFEYNAIDYLLKPIDPDKLVLAVDKIQVKAPATPSMEQIQALLQSMQSQTLDRISLPTSEGLRYFKIKEITRLEASNNYTTFYSSTKEKVMVSKTIKNYERILPPEIFYRVHQSHIININFVTEFLKEDGGYALMEDKSKIPVSRRKKNGLIDALDKTSL